MSFLFISLLIVALVAMWWMRRQGIKDDAMVMAFMIIVGLCLAACGGEHTSPPATAPMYSVSYSPGYMFVEVHVSAGTKVSGLTLTYDRDVQYMDYDDLCVQVMPTHGGTGMTWFALPHGSTCLLQDPGTTPLTEGTYIITLTYHVGRHVSDPSMDKDMTPALIGCQVTK